MEKFSDQTFKIHGPLKNADPSVYYYGDRVVFYNLHYFSNVLQSFGHLISSLEINLRNIDKKDSLHIGGKVVSYCSKDLRHLTLGDCDLKELFEKKSSLQNVEHVTFSGDIKNDGTINLKQFLPKMQWLSFNSVRLSNLNMFDDEFSHLEQLSVNFSPYENPIRFKEMLTRKLLKKNQQIQYVELVNADTSFLRALNENSKPTILKIQRLINEENLNESPKKVVFDGLDEIELNFVNEIELEGFIDFMEDSLVNLKKLQLKKGTINDQQLINLARSSPNLIEASLDCVVNAMPNNITTFAQFNGKLNTLYLKTSNETLQDTLLEQLGNGWTITQSISDSNLVGITIER